MVAPSAHNVTLPYQDLVFVEDGPVVSPDTTAEEARRVIAASPFDWTSVVRDGELLGWVDLELLEGCTRVGDARPRP